MALGMASCLKDTPSTDLSHAGTIIEMIYPPAAQSNGVGTGLEYFSGGSLLYPSSDVSDTITFYVNIAGTNTLSKPLTVTVGVNNAALNDNISNDGITYVAMPDSDYHIIKTSGTIPAGSRMDTFQVVVFPSKIDPTKNYGLPIAVTAPGYTISGNFGKLYLHTIGNPIAGSYNWDFTRWNSLDTTTAPTGASFTGGSNSFAPDNPTQIEVQSGYAYNPRYVLSFTNNGGTLSNFQISMNASDVTTLSNAGITVTSGPFIMTADPVHGVYRFYYTVKNSSGNRFLIDKYYK